MASGPMEGATSTWGRQGEPTTETATTNSKPRATAAIDDGDQCSTKPMLSDTRQPKMSGTLLTVMTQVTRVELDSATRGKQKRHRKEEMWKATESTTHNRLP